MSKRPPSICSAAGRLLVLMAAWPLVANSQVPVDQSGSELSINDEIPLLSATELEQLVGPIALYPDDLLAIILPATTFPLQLVQAERFLQELKHDPELEPDEDWDDSIVALINYPEAVELLCDELDKTWRLGEAVVVQQTDVIAAVESFRDRAYAAGNLRSDSRQTVAENEGVIEISPVDEDVLYVPYYEPEKVVVYQPAPAYYYYPRPYPVYYYPYPYGYSFNSGFFWGVTTAFTIGWFTDSLHVYHHSYYGHPYYGRSYYNHHHWYRYPTVYAHNNYYYGGHSGHAQHYNNHWQPHSSSTVNAYSQRVTRSRQYPGTGSRSSTESGAARIASSQQHARKSSSDIKFQDRSVSSQTRTTTKPARNTSSTRTLASTQSYKFRERESDPPRQYASQNTRSNSASRSSQAKPSNHSSRVSQAKPVNQPSRVSQAKSPSQPAKARQPSQASHSRQSSSNHSGSNKTSNSGRNSSQRR